MWRNNERQNDRRATSRDRGAQFAAPQAPRALGPLRIRPPVSRAVENVLGRIPQRLVPSESNWLIDPLQPASAAIQTHPAERSSMTAACSRDLHVDSDVCN